MNKKTKIGIVDELAKKYCCDHKAIRGMIKCVECLQNIEDESEALRGVIKTLLLKCFVTDETYFHDINAVFHEVEHHFRKAPTVRNFEGNNGSHTQKLSSDQITSIVEIHREIWEKIQSHPSWNPKEIQKLLEDDFFHQPMNDALKYHISNKISRYMLEWKRRNFWTLEGIYDDDIKMLVINHLRIEFNEPKNSVKIGFQFGNMLGTFHNIFEEKHDEKH